MCPATAGLPVGVRQMEDALEFRVGLGVGGSIDRYSNFKAYFNIAQEKGGSKTSGTSGTSGEKKVKNNFRGPEEGSRWTGGAEHKMNVRSSQMNGSLF